MAEVQCSSLFSILNCLQLCISDVIDMLQVFPLICVTIGQIVKKWQQFFAIQDDGGRYGRHLELWLLRFFRRYRCVLNQSSNIPTKFGDDWSNSKEMAIIFRNLI